MIDSDKSSELEVCHEGKLSEESSEDSDLSPESLSPALEINESPKRKESGLNEQSICESRLVHLKTLANTKKKFNSSSELMTVSNVRGFSSLSKYQLPHGLSFKLKLAKTEDDDLEESKDQHVRKSEPNTA